MELRNWQIGSGVNGVQLENDRRRRVAGELSGDTRPSGDRDLLRL
jgi:hypothetical protein